MATFRRFGNLLIVFARFRFDWYGLRRIVGRSLLLDFYFLIGDLMPGDLFPDTRFVFAVGEDDSLRTLASFLSNFSSRRAEYVRDRSKH